MWRLVLGRGGARAGGGGSAVAALGAPQGAAARAAAARRLGAGRGGVQRGCTSLLLLSVFSPPGWQKGRQRDGWKQEQTARSLPRLVPRYSVLDAVTWGALAALLLQLARQISWLRSLPETWRERRSPWLLRSPLPSQQSVATEASTSCPRRQLQSHFLQEAGPDVVPENSSSRIPSEQGESQPCADVGEFQIPEGSSLGPAPHSAQGDVARQGHLEEAAFQLQQIFRIDISIAFNILGIESMRAGRYRTAYTCFKLAADRGYSKAQFNVGLCYEHGRGTEKDLEKAAFYYYHAASSCHPMAQYRYARCLLCHRPESEWDSLQKAVTFLEQAAMAGITEGKELFR
ncbi:death ligand signal enhancer [Struthio camelus]|uniref:death ligand signal enhancer n=1 Tax=Struthio camelus TaxID=8801 RepID=UPI003603B697